MLSSYKEFSESQKPLKKLVLALGHFSQVTNTQRVQPRRTVLWPKKKKKDNTTGELKEKNLSPNFKKDYLVKVWFYVFTAVSFINTVTELQNTVSIGKLYEKFDLANILALA